MPKTGLFSLAGREAEPIEPPGEQTVLFAAGLSSNQSTMRDFGATAAATIHLKDLTALQVKFRVTGN
jgi:hypothetical protein